VSLSPLLAEGINTTSRPGHDLTNR
jgi:hypothetical protein